VQDQWADSALREFQKACHHWRDDPGRTQEVARRVLEGCAHVVRVAWDPSFQPHRGGELRREPLGELLPFMRSKLPAELWLFVNEVKKRGDLHHHNQGEVVESSPRMAQTTLLQCAALLEWMYGIVLLRPPPSALEEAVHDVHERRPAAGPVAPAPPASPRGARRVVLALAAVLAVVVLGATGAAIWLPTWDAPAVTAPPSPGSRAAFGTLGEPERTWIAAYQGALEARDVDRLLSLHVLPTRRFYMALNYDGAHVRRAYQGWFDKAGPARRTGFDGCALAQVGPDGSRALQCDAFVDPPLPGGPARVPTCLVFTSEGKLLSRTEIGTVSSCPPP
jgi:hypothetical protein